VWGTTLKLNPKPYSLGGIGKFGKGSQTGNSDERETRGVWGGGPQKKNHKKGGVARSSKNPNQRGLIKNGRIFSSSFSFRSFRV